MNLAGKKLFVGLSGGVDSAVAAALLAQRGARVTGVFIKGWYPPELPCTWAADRRDAMRVAARLRLPFATLDASTEYKQSVLDYLVREYKAGRTPNPDVMCNRDVKFGAFYRYARTRGAECIATGHYARTPLWDSTTPGEAPLLRGADAAKDQSYFLWAVPKEALARTIFPLGAMAKAEVRGLARRFSLPVADKPDSQGICFLGAISVADFLRSELGEEEGPAEDSAGRVVGRHDGVLLYTLGERAALRNAQEAGPWYVIAKDLARNALVVAQERASRLRTPAGIPFDSANWHAEPAGVLAAQYRYHGPSVEGRVAAGRFEPAAPLPEAPAPGQSIVFYKGDALVGGGIIAA